jgi:hypothetical protein
MKLKTILSIILFFLANNIHAQNAKTIVENYFKVIGGLEKWKTIKNIKIIRSQKFSEEENFINTIFIIPHKALRYESVLENGSNHSIYSVTNHSGWRLNAPLNSYSSIVVNPINNDDSKQLIAQSDLLYGLDNVFNSEYQTELFGVRMIDGKSSFEVRITSKEGNMLRYFFDENTYILNKIMGNILVLGMSQPVKSEVNFSEYKEIEGIKFPFQIGISSKDVMFGQIRYFNVESIKLNTEFDVNLFNKPN